VEDVAWLLLDKAEFPVLPVQVKAVNTAQTLRKPHWFEKFNWFVTSENHLVLSGRDAQQNELLVKRYLRKDDLYVHADLHGAATTIIRNNGSTKPGKQKEAPLLLSSMGQLCEMHGPPAHFCGAVCQIDQNLAIITLHFSVHGRQLGPLRQSMCPYAYHNENL